MAEKSKDISEKGCIDYANQVAELFDLQFPKISCIQDINSHFFISLFNCITDVKIPDLLLGNDSTIEAHNVQAFIDTLSLDLLNLSLSHVTGEDVVSGNIFSILCLLEILESLFLHLNPHKKKNAKETIATSSSKDNYKTIPTEKIIRKTTSLKSTSTSSDEDIPPISRPLKRKTCRRTLQKSHQNNHIPQAKTEVSQRSAETPHSKRHTDTVDRFKSPLKRKISKPLPGKVKRPHTEGIEEMYDLNFENKVRVLLCSDKSPTLRAHQLKKNYIQSLQTPLKKKPIPACKKSFLLPHNLRRRRKSPTQQSPTRKTSQRGKSFKKTVAENTEKHEDTSDTPAFIQSMLEEFPGFKFPNNIQNLLKKQYYQHINQMHKQLRGVLLKKPRTVIQNEKALEDQAKLSTILLKDIKEKSHLRELNEHNDAVNKIKYGFRDARLQSAKTKQYYNEFHTSMSRKMKKRNFSEEVLVEKTFKKILDEQKKKVQELCQRVKETDEQDAKQHRKYLNALKNLYQEQMSMLAESVNAEQKESSERAKAQKWAFEKRNQQICKNLQKEVRSLQKDVLDMIQDIHFRELDAQNYISSFQQQDS